MNLIIHIGVHKTATTWLQENLFSIHPEINLLNDFMTPWNDELMDYLIQPNPSFSSKRCYELFEKKINEIPLKNRENIMVISSEELTGSPFSGAYNRKEIAERIFKTFPFAKIMLTIRNQSDIIVSWHQQMIKMGYVGTISQMLDENIWVRPCFKKESFDYLSIYKLYSQYYDKDSIGVFTQEELKFDSKGFIENVYNFLGIGSNSFKVDAKPVAKGISDRKVTAMRLTNFLRKTDYYPYPICNITSPMVRKVLTKSISLLPFLSSQKNIYNHKYRSGIFDFFEDSNRELFSELQTNSLDDKIVYKYYNKK